MVFNTLQQATQQLHAGLLTAVGRLLLRMDQTPIGSVDLSLEICPLLRGDKTAEVIKNGLSSKRCIMHSLGSACLRRQGC